MDECGKCKSKISADEKFISCDSCRILLHLREKCCGMSPSEIKAVVIQKRVLLFFCDECRLAFKNVPMLIRKINDLSVEVEKLKKVVSELETQNNCLNNSEVLAEIEERINRSYNVIIYNVAESSADNVSQRIEDDKAVINNILSETSISFEINKVVRIGKKQFNNNENKIRPVKVIFSSASTAKEILKNKNKLHTTKYRLANDFTPNQLKYMHNLRNELAQRVGNGENLTIRYINGIPKIAAPKPKN